MHTHPSADVRAACLKLADALCSWERATGRENVIIIKDTIGCEYRAMSGSPVPDHVSDAQLLEGFTRMMEDQNPQR